MLVLFHVLDQMSYLCQVLEISFTFVEPFSVKYISKVSFMESVVNKRSVNILTIGKGLIASTLEQCVGVEGPTIAVFREKDTMFLLTYNLRRCIPLS